MSPETLAAPTPASADAPAATTPPVTRIPRITSIDALRGFVMWTMIFVNDLAGAPKRLVPDWMVHFSDRHKSGSGMTFVDLVFPGFLFIVGMSIPFALGSRLNKGEPAWKTLFHVLVRTLSLLTLGILMVHETPDSKQLGWSSTLWVAMMFTSAIFAFSSLSWPGKVASPRRDRIIHIANMILRGLGFVALLYLALAFVSRRGQHIINLYPFSISTSWYGILGLIGWAYLATAIIFLVFRTHRTALLACIALMTCFYAADKKGFFDDFWLNHVVDMGGTLGSQAAITVAGLLLGSILVAPDTRTHGSRIKFTLLFIGGFAFAALLTNGLYGISKNAATPSWCLWSAAITAALWLLFYLWIDVRPQSGIAKAAKPLAIAGQNVLLAYLMSEMMEAVFDLLNWGDWYDGLAQHTLAGAIARSAGCGIVLLAITAGLNRVGFRLRL